MIFSVAKILNSMIALQGFFYAAQDPARGSVFLFFSFYLYFFSVCEYCEGSFLLRRARPGWGYYAVKGVVLSLIAYGVLTAAGSDIAYLAALFVPMPLMSHGSGPSKSKIADKQFVVFSVSALVVFSTVLWLAGPSIAFAAYLPLFGTGCFLRYRRLSALPNDGAPATSKELARLTFVSLFIPAPRNLDLLFVQIIGAGPTEMAVSLGLRLVNVCARGPMFLYSYYFPPRVGSLENVFKGRYASLALGAAAAAFVLCYGAVWVMVPDVHPITLALYALAICCAAYIGEMLRFFSSGKALIYVAISAPLVMSLQFALFYVVFDRSFAVAFAMCFGFTVFPIYVLAYLWEVRATEPVTA